MRKSLTNLRKGLIIRFILFTENPEPSGRVSFPVSMKPVSITPISDSRTAGGAMVVVVRVVVVVLTVVVAG